MCCRVGILTPLDKVLAALMAEDAIADPVASLPHDNLARRRPPRPGRPGEDP
jgi:hypothetical protein